MIPTTGERFGPYEILGTLGRGGVGEVYRAWDRRLEREVALKVLHEDYPQPGNRERFLLEARAASALNHPNICTIFDLGEKSGWPYLVMELLKGISLKHRIERSPLPPDEVVRIGSEIAAALGAAHALRIIHRDIKPANVMLMRQSDGCTQAKVLDFGLAKLTGPLPGRLTHHDEHLTVVGEAVGTVSYMSPEQARGEELDSRSDLFSLGVVMYEMATRRTPFHGTTTALLFAQLLNADPEPIRAWNDSIPRALEKIIFRLLEKRPAERFQQASEVVDALHGIAARLESGRWRKASSPAVPLVRVEEPVARQELPARPQFLREQPRLVNKEATASGDLGEGSRVARDSGRRVGQASGGAGVGSAAAVGSGSSCPSSEVERVAHGPTLTEEALRNEERRGPRLQWRRMWLPGGVAAAVLCAAGAAFTVRAAGTHAAALTPADTVMITAVENHTGVQTLDGSIAEGLEFGLAQTPGLSIRSAEEFLTVLHAQGADGQPASQALARQAAESAGAHAFVYGEVREGEPGAHSTAAGFSLHVAVLETAGGRELASADARAGRIEEIPGAIDQVTHVLVQQLTGNTGAAGGRRRVPLAREASGNLNALHAYAAAVAAEAVGRRTAALRWFGVAAATDPAFVQAEIETAWLAREAKAESAAAEAARHALDASRDRSPRTMLLAETAGELVERNNPERALAAAKTLLDQNPHDPSARLAEVRVLRAAGDYRQAEHTAQQALAASVRTPDLFRETELALIALDRYDDALSLEDRSAQSSAAHPEIALEAGYLAGREDRVAAAVAELERLPEDATLFAPVRAAYYDNRGQLAQGETAWADAARVLRSQPAMAGAGEWMLARAALNRALAGECGTAVEFAQAAVRVSAGTEARSAAGLAQVLCNSPEENQEANRQLAARVGTAIVAGNPAQAAAALNTLPESGADPVLVYLRGLAHLQAGSAADAANDFEQVLAARGVAFGGATDLYALAQFKLARALSEAGEPVRSTDAYRRFIALWSGAGPTDRLRAEAVAGLHGMPLTTSDVVAPRQLAAAQAPAATTRRSPAPRAARQWEPFPTPSWLMPSAAQVPESPSTAAAGHEVESAAKEQSPSWAGGAASLE